MKRLLISLLACLVVSVAAAPGAPAVVQIGGGPINLELPVVSGLPQVGSTLSCSDGLWLNADTFTRRWLRDGAPITGATATDYTAQGDDLGHVLSCEVTATNVIGSASATSLPTAPVTAAPSSSPPPVAPPANTDSGTPPATNSGGVTPSSPACVAIPSVARDRSVRLAGGGKVTLVTRQVDDAANPLRASVRSAGGSPVVSVAYKINGRALESTRAGALPVGALRSGRTPNRLVATATLRDGRRVSVTQLFIVTRCPMPAVACKRLDGGRRLVCSSRTPLGGRRVRVTVTGPQQQVVTGRTGVKRGRYQITIRSRTALAAGSYVYRHVVTTAKRGERMFMVRTVTVA